VRARLVANAAGPLLPAVAAALRVCFPAATVLPCYGMTVKPYPRLSPEPCTLKPHASFNSRP